MTTPLQRPIRAFLCALALIATTVGIGLAPAASAVSPNGGVYGITAPRDGWCARPLIAWWNSTTGQSGTDYTAADDIFWLPVRLGTNNTITLAVYCGSTSRSWYGSIRPTRTKQSVFFRYPSGYTLK